MFDYPTIDAIASPARAHRVRDGRSLDRSMTRRERPASRARREARSTAMTDDEIAALLLARDERQ